MNIKKKVFPVLFSCEIILILLIFCFGSEGIPKIISLKKEKEHIHTEVIALENEIKSLEQTIHLWDQYPFYKERLAREQLQMARKNESIYYFS